MALEDLCDFLYTLWIQHHVSMATSVSEIQKIIDEALEGESPHLRSVPDRETWGSTPADIEAARKMEAMAQRGMAKRKPK